MKVSDPNVEFTKYYDTKIMYLNTRCNIRILYLVIVFQILESNVRHTRSGAPYGRPVQVDRSGAPERV